MASWVVLTGLKTVAGHVDQEDSSDVMTSCISRAGNPGRRENRLELVFDESMRPSLKTVD